jgi:hypothetical protein
MENTVADIVLLLKLKIGIMPPLKSILDSFGYMLHFKGINITLHVILRLDPRIHTHSESSASRGTFKCRDDLDYSWMAAPKGLAMTENDSESQ